MRTYLSYFTVCAVTALVLSGMAAWLALRNPLSLTAVLLWIVAIGVLLWAAWWHDRKKLVQQVTSKYISWSWIQIALVASITLVAFGLRAYDLAHYPPPFHGDEGEMGVLALGILNGQLVPPFATGWLDHPTMFHYMQAASLALGGRDEAGLRMLSAVWGAACVPAIYALGRVGWGRIAGITAAWLLAVSHLHIHFSRIGLNNIQSVFSMIALVLLLALVYERSIRSLTLLCAGAGLAMGLSQYFYYGSRLLPVIALPLVWWLWRAKRITAAQIGTIAISFVVVYAPLAWFYVNHWAAFTSRTATVSVFSERGVQHTLGSSASLPTDLVPLLQLQITRNLGFFLNYGDRSSFYIADLAAFDPITRVLFWLGLATAIVFMRHYHDRAIVTWWAIGLLLAGVLTNDAPNAPRLLLIVPAVFVCAGVVVERVWQQGQRLWPVQWWHIAPIVVATCAFTLALNTHTYFFEYGRIAGNLTPISAARAMIEEPRAEAVFLLGAPHLYAGHGTLQFVAGSADPRDLDAADQISAALEAGDDVLVVAVPQRADEIDVIQQQYPGGTRTIHTDPLERVTSIAYRIPANR